MKRQKTFNNNSSKLYLVGTPIGNLEDITYRAVKTLEMADIIYCEDTRVSKKLLKHYEITTPLKSFHLFNENEIAGDIIRLLMEGKNIAIISDAGLPTISDPGYIAVKKAIEEDIDVVVIPGASAGISALIASGLSTYKYLFVGFLNSKTNKRRNELKKLQNGQETIVMYESPHRINETLMLIDEIFGERPIVLARELTKIHEEYLRGSAREILENEPLLKGEMVIIINGSAEVIDEELNGLPLEQHYQYYLEQGYESKTALKNVSSDRGVSKNDIYDSLFKKEKKTND